MVNAFVGCALLYALLVDCVAADSITYVSNLENRWPGQGPGEIGDIHSVSAYGPTTLTFSTGNQGTTLDAVTLEFFIERGSVGSWGSVDVRLRTSDAPAFVAQLGTPQLNPAKTQWPMELFPNAYTQFVDFQPAGAIYLPPLTDFQIVISRQPGSLSDSALLYTKSATHRSQDGWEIGPTISANPFAVGEFVKFAVRATAVPEPTIYALVALGLVFASFTYPKDFRN